MAQQSTMDAPETGGGAGDERSAARDLSETVTEAGAEAKRRAAEVTREATERAAAEADGMKDQAVAGLSAFADALKSASGDLSGQKLGFAGDLVSQAASGLEGLSRSLEGRSSGEMLDAVRSFGRSNPMAFIAGSVLAGFALGRVAAAAGAGPSAEARRASAPPPRQAMGETSPYAGGSVQTSTASGGLEE